MVSREGARDPLWGALALWYPNKCKEAWESWVCLLTAASGELAKVTGEAEKLREFESSGVQQVKVKTISVLPAWILLLFTFFFPPTHAILKGAAIKPASSKRPFLLHSCVCVCVWMGLCHGSVAYLLFHFKGSTAINHHLGVIFWDIWKCHSETLNV